MQSNATNGGHADLVRPTSHSNLRRQHSVLPCGCTQACKPELESKKHSPHPRSIYDSDGKLCRVWQLAAVHEQTDLHFGAHNDPPSSLPIPEIVLHLCYCLSGQ